MMSIQERGQDSNYSKNKSHNNKNAQTNCLGVFVDIQK